MSNFKEYAGYYDLIYRDKDYRGEALYISSLLKEFAPGAKNILNIGCGTGKHDYLLTEMGYRLTGVDLSEDMVSQAMTNRPANLMDALSFFHGDFRSLSLNKSFDAVISLFHVVSYQNSNHEVLQAFATARKHLLPGGIFVFDFWYGPGVLTDPPVVRVREYAGRGFSFTRTSRPTMHSSENKVDVEFVLDILHDDGSRKQIREHHPMRYFFLPELKFYLEKSGFSFLEARAWMQNSAPETTTWNTVVMASAV